jgi:flagellar biogenesis protein FliO
METETVMGIMEQFWPGSGSRSNRDSDRSYRQIATAAPGRIGENAAISNTGHGLGGHGLTGWLLRCWRRSTAHPARLALIERIALGPKHSVALIEAEGVRLLVAISTDGAPVFFSLQRPSEDSAPLPDPGEGVEANRPEECGAEEFSGALSQAASRGIRRNLRQGQGTRRLGFEGRVSW